MTRASASILRLSVTPGSSFLPRRTPHSSSDGSMSTRRRPPNVLLSGPPGPARGHRGRLCAQSCPNVLGNQGGSRPVSKLRQTWLRFAYQPRVRSRPTPSAGARGNRGKPHEVNPIIGRTCGPHTNDRSVAPAANAGVSPREARVDLPTSERRAAAADAAGSPQLAACAVIRRSRLQ